MNEYGIINYNGWSKVLVYVNIVKSCDMNYSLCKHCNTTNNDYKCFNPSCILNTTYKIKSYINQLSNSQNSMESIIDTLIPILKDFTNTIFFIGIGKSAHIINKCIATWQSLGIRAHSLLQQDLFHGDLGIIQENDIIIYISNSGNTEELIHVSSYIKTNFKVVQICISNNPSAKLNSIVNYSFIICNFKIKEADAIDMTPSVSSMLFMVLLDLIGIHLAELRGITKPIFKKFHPGGSLGKIE